MMNRAYSLLEIKSIDDGQRIIEGIATTPETDRVGDIVEPSGAEFTLPLPLLWHHDSTQPIGHVVSASVGDDGIRIRAQMVRTDEPGTLKDRLDEAWQSIKLGLVRGLSIGFKGVEVSFLEDNSGIRFIKWLWLELSAVTIAANASANITTIKAISVSEQAASGRKAADPVRLIPPGGSGTTKPKPTERTMTYTEQIAALESTRAAKTALMASVMQKSMDEGRATDEAEQESFDTLEKEVTDIDGDLKRLTTLEKMNRQKAEPVAGTTQKEGSDSRSVEKRPHIQVRQNTMKGVGYARLLSARFIAKENNIHPADVALSKGWGEELASILRMPKDILQKAAVAAANTTDATWAGPLVIYQNLQNEFIELLRPNSIIERIPGLRRVPFNVKVPRETGTMTAYWVGQGSPKPVTKGALDTVTLDFAKVAGITFQTQELLRFSQPNSEPILINSLVKAITYLVDRDFLDPAKTAVTGVSPASITNGSTAITASGTTADAFRADFARLLALYTAANYNLSSLVLVMTQTQALRLALMRNDFGNREFADLTKDGGTLEGIPVITSENVVANGGSPTDGWIIVAMNANDILVADDGDVDVDVSTEASIQVDDAPDSPNTASTVLVSLWQNNLVGIRCERFITWAKARTNSVVYITGGNYQ